jgi:hypothetical protein
VCNCTYSIDAFPTEQVSCVRLDDMKCTSRKVPRVMMPPAVHVFWSHRGSSLCCPPTARPEHHADFATTSGRGCVCALYPSLAVRRRRPRLPGGVCTKADTSCRTFQHGSGTPHGHKCEVYMRRCHKCLLLLCATCAKSTVPALGRNGLGYMLVNGPSWGPARLEMHPQPSRQSASHAARGLSGL